MAGLFLATLPTPAQAQAQTYPLDTRAGFMTGCLLQDPPNQGFNAEVYQVMSLCLCMLDKFEQVYSHDQFVALSEGYDKNQPDQVRELQGFVSLNLPACQNRLSS